MYDRKTYRVYFLKDYNEAADFIEFGIAMENVSLIYEFVIINETCDKPVKMCRPNIGAQFYSTRPQRLFEVNQDTMDRVFDFYKQNNIPFAYTIREFDTCSLKLP